MMRIRSSSPSVAATSSGIFHGDEDGGLSPEDLYDEADARQAGEEPTFVVDLVGRSFSPP
jgi:hypothetical protein